jgi:hypothetical protein
MLWIAVPGGIAAGSALLRVLIVPKLDGGTLADHGMAQWPPQALMETGGTVRVELHGPDEGQVAHHDVVPAIFAQPGLWQRFVTGLVVENAMTPRSAEPDGGQLVVHATSQDKAAIARTLQTAFSGQVTTALGARSPGFMLKARDALLKEPHWLQEAPQPSPASIAAPSEDSAGFHRALSMLREHPTVLRALGLIIELRLDARDVAGFAGGTAHVLWPGRSDPLPQVVSPRTRFDAEFLPGSTLNVNAGMVTLDRRDEIGSRWDVAVVDVDVAAQRMREAARALAGRPDEAPMLPALRSGGLRLVLRGRGQEMMERLNRAAARARAVEPVALTADDLILGYRIDVLPGLGTPRWFSLHRRRATYRIHQRLDTGGISEDFTVVGSPDEPEEGHIKTNAAILDSTGLHADETVVAWKGWSLAAPRPRLDPGPQPPPPSKPDMNVTMSFDAEPRSVPPLRFGRAYTLRARVVDITGGGLELDDPAADRHRTEPVFYLRHEPLASPDVAFPPSTNVGPPDPGEWAGHIVVRSDPTARLGIGEYADRFGYRLDNTRLLHPPRTTLEIAEQHGVFDLDGDEATVNRRTWEWAKRALVAADPNVSEAPGLPDPAAGGIVVVHPRPGAPLVLQEVWGDLDRWPDLTSRTLELATRRPGEEHVEWVGDRLVVRLAPAEQITVEISTFPREGILDRFALHEADLPGISVDAAGKGRHPMLSPTRTLTLVHAVQRPLRAPETVLSASRQQNTTFAVLAPQSPLLDPPSTAQLDITASWDDQVDHTPQQVTDAPVATLTIDPDGPAQPETLFRHEFGDTRHRTVTYTLKAVSRFRQYFRESDDLSDFVQTRTLDPVVIRSASRPAPPVVLAARPAFLWKESGSLDTPSGVLTRERLGTRVRLALQPPWHTTGVGELLAVVLRPETDGSDVLDDRLAGFVSQAGDDPVYRSLGGLRDGGPFARHIAGGVSEHRLRVEEAGADLVIKAHEPEYDESGQCWLCDVTLAGTGTTSFDYTFVQLAVARYQPNSLNGLWLSDVVKTDMVPLLPDRTLRVTRFADHFEVRLTGHVSAAEAIDRVDVVLERCQRPEGLPADQVELIGFESGSDDVPAWIPVRFQSPEPRPAGLSPTLKRWTSNIFPGPEPGPFRLRIREVEFIPNRTDRPDAHLQSGTPGEIKERTVFTDIVPLPAL